MIRAIYHCQECHALAGEFHAETCSEAVGPKNEVEAPKNAVSVANTTPLWKPPDSSPDHVSQSGNFPDSGNIDQCPECRGHGTHHPDCEMSSSSIASEAGNSSQQQNNDDCAVDCAVRDARDDNDLIASMAETFTRCLLIAREKNADYAGDGDPFKNFLASEFVGVDPRRAILVRMSDKLGRLANLIDADPEVTAESFDDSCDDLVNYPAILKALNRAMRVD